MSDALGGQFSWRITLWRRRADGQILCPSAARGTEEWTHPRLCRKRFGASVWDGHRHSCNPAAFPKAPISACSVISKFLPPVQSNFSKPSCLQSVEKHECSEFLLLGGSKSPKPAYSIKDLMVFQINSVVWQQWMISECATSAVTSVICKMWG